MSFKLFRLNLLTFCCVVGFVNNAYSNSLSPSSFNALYSLAAQGNLTAINGAIARGLNIDSLNEYSDTGLCVAAKRRDKKAFKTFVQAGANTNHYCTWHINGYQDFARSAFANPVKNQNTVLLDKDKLLSLKSKILIGAGVVTAGAGVGLALGGGGGGSSYDPNCVHGYYNEENKCTCYTGYDGEKCDKCDKVKGYDFHGTNRCYLTLDENVYKNGHQVGDKWVCDEGYAGETCDRCAEGYGDGNGNKCTRKDKRIIGNDMNDNFNGEGTIEVKNKDNTFRDMYGMYYDADKTPHNYLLEQNTLANYFRDYSNAENQETTKFVEVWDEETQSNIKKEVTEKVAIDISAKSENVLEDPTAPSEDESEGKTEDPTAPSEDESEGKTEDPTAPSEDESEGKTEDPTAPSEDESEGKTKDPAALIQIDNNNNDSDIYGMYSNNAEKIYNAFIKINDALFTGTAEAKITINNVEDSTVTNDGDVYGIFGNHNIYSADAEGEPGEGTNITLKSTIDITSASNGSVYGIYNNSSNPENANIYHLTKTISSDKGVINIISDTQVHNSTNGNAYGLYSIGLIENSGKVTSNTIKGTSYGIYTEGGKVVNVKDANETELINSIESSSMMGAAYGIYAKGGEIENGRIVNVILTDPSNKENAYGIYLEKTKDKPAKLINTSGITVLNNGTGNAYGIYNKGGEVINSTQRYAIDVTTNNGGTAYGIYSDGGSVDNSGYIHVNAYQDAGTNYNDGKAYGIYATNGATVTNHGNFLFNINGQELSPTNKDQYCTSSGCKFLSGNYAIYLENGARFVNAGTVTTSASLDLGQKGTQLALGGNFTASSLSGNLEVANSVVTKGFNNEYIVSNAINADDVSNLNLSSESVLFDAKLQGNDVVLSKKGFNKLVNNQDMAQFLENNYALSNNEHLFNEIKSKTSKKELNSMLNQISGQDVFSSFASEDILLQQELDFDINNQLYKVRDNHFALTGNVSSNTFDHNGAQTKYAVSGKNIGNMRLGVGMAISDINSDNYHNDNSRYGQNYQFMMPVSFNNNGLNTIITPKLAYSYGTYSRNGYNDIDYKGKIEKQLFGVSAQSKYNFEIFGLNIMPTSEANLTAYKTKISEDKKQFSLSSNNAETYSATLGFGAFVEKETSFSKDNKFNLMLGAMLYHEFANPYDIKMNINGMHGSFNLQDENRQNNYMVLRSKFSYDLDKVSLYGDFLSYIDNQHQSKINLGFQYRF